MNFMRKQLQFSNLTTVVSLVALVGWLSPSYAQVLLHDFNDGTSGQFIDIEDFAADSPFGPTQASIVDGKLVLGSKGPAPTFFDDPAAFFRRTWEPSLNSTEFTNGIFRATISPHQQEALGGLILRAGVDPNEVDYEFWRDPALGSFWFGRWEKPNDVFDILAATEEGSEPYVEGEEWIIEAGVVNSEISLKYWKPGDAEPDAPQLMVQDSGIAPYDVDASRVELAVYHESPDLVEVSAGFDDVYFTAVPEPTVIALLLFGLPALGVFRRTLNTSR